MKEFENRSILITGASQGIGKACAIKFATEGAYTFINYSKNEAAAQVALDDVKSFGGKGKLVKANIGIKDEIDKLWDKVMERNQIPGALILNAAYQKKGTVAETDIDLIQQTFDVNVKGNFYLAKKYCDACVQNNQPGVVVVHSSNQAEFVNPTGFAYSMSKAALNQMVRHLAYAYCKKQIRVNGVILGWFDTEGERKFYSKEQIASQAANNIPLQRAGDPMEAAEFSYYLASNKSSYITGSLLRVDGGFALAPDLST